MIVLYAYLIFAISTGLTSYLTLYIPTVARLSRDHDMEPDTVVVSSITYIIVSTLTAPAILIQTLKGCTEDYFAEILASIEEDDEEA